MKILNNVNNGYVGCSILGMQMIMLILNWMIIPFDSVYSCTINNGWMFNPLGVRMVTLKREEEVERMLVLLELSI